MPVVRISLSAQNPIPGRSIGDYVHQAMTETINIPDDDRFQIISKHGSDELLFDRSFYGVERGDGFMVIDITLAIGRSTAIKKKLYSRIVELLSGKLDVNPGDVFISLNEIIPDNFSLGNGEAQFVDNPPPHLQALR